MRVKITKGGTFGHPDPTKYGQVFRANTDEIVEVDEEQGAWLIELGRAVGKKKRKKKEVEIAPPPKEIEDPELHTFEEDPEEIEDPEDLELSSSGCEPCEEKKRKRGRPPGRRRL